MSHTPGPWRCEEPDTDGCVNVTAKSTKPASGLALVARCGSQLEDNAANGKLIAAAPALLAALKLFLIAAELDGYGSETLLREAVRAIAAADPDFFDDSALEEQP
jgi:hypothetical protein